METVLLRMDGGVAQRRGFPGPAMPGGACGATEGPLDFGRCREVAVAGFRSLSADAGTGSQAGRELDSEEDALEGPLAGGQAGGTSPGSPASWARPGRVHVADDAALSRGRKGQGGLPGSACGVPHDPKRGMSPRVARARELGLVPCGPGGGGGGSPRQGRARELGMATDGGHRQVSPAGAVRGRDSRRAESTPHMHPACKGARASRGADAGHAAGAPEGAARAGARNSGREAGSGISLAGGAAGNATSAVRIAAADGTAPDTKAHPAPPPPARAGTALPLSARRGAMVPELHTGGMREHPARRDQDVDEAPPVKMLPGAHRAFARADQCSPSRHNCPPGLPRSRNASPWRLPQHPSPGKASPGRAFPGQGSAAPSPLSSVMPSSAALLPAASSAASSAGAGAGVSPRCPDPGRAQSGAVLGSSGGVPHVLTAAMSKSGALSASSSPVASPLRRRLAAASGGGSSGGGISLSAFQLDLIATAAASPGPKVRGYGASPGRGASGGGVAVASHAQGATHRCSSISGPGFTAAVASGSARELREDMARSNSQLSTARGAVGAAAGVWHGEFRSRFGPALDAADRLAQAVANSRAHAELAGTAAWAGAAPVLLRRAQNVQARESPAFAAKRAAIRKGVRDQQQAERQRVHRRGASFAGEPGQSLDLCLGPDSCLSWEAPRDPARGACDTVPGSVDGVPGAPMPAGVPGAPMPVGASGPGQPGKPPGKPAGSPLSKFRHSWGNEPDFLRCTPWMSEDAPGHREGGVGALELMADYSIKRGQDLAQILQGPKGPPKETHSEAASPKGEPVRARRHQPRHSMDLGNHFYVVEDGEGTSGVAWGPAKRKGSLPRAAKDPSSLAGGVLSQGPLGPFSLGQMGTTGLRPQDHVLGQPYDDITHVYAMHRKDLGAGQFGVVRKCKEISTGAVYACKSIRKECIRCADDAEDIRKEAACMGLLEKHPRFVNLHRTFEDKEHVHLVMDLCSGGDLLDNIIANGPLPEPRAAGMCRTLVEALLHCQCLGIVHRDVKPENILLTSVDPDCDMKLVDFGVSTFFKPGEALTEIIGTPEYMAPEMLKQSYGPEADIWSAGVVLYVALTSVPPFWASDRQSLTESILQKEVRFKASRWAGISEECKDLVFKMLMKDPTKRIKATDVLHHPWIVENCPF